MYGRKEGHFTLHQILLGPSSHGQTLLAGASSQVNTLQRPPCISPVAVFSGILERFKHFEHSFETTQKKFQWVLSICQKLMHLVAYLNIKWQGEAEDNCTGVWKGPSKNTHLTQF